MTTDDPTENGNDPKGDISKLRDQAGKVGPLEETNADLTRELAFVRAGIDTTTDLGAMMMRGYDGELTPEALSKLATQMGSVPGTPPDPVQDPIPVQDPPSPVDAMEELAGGLAPGITPPPDVMETAWTAYQDRMKAGARQEDASAEVINRIIDAAVREQKGEAGYKGFIYDQQAYHEKLRGG